MNYELDRAEDRAGEPHLADMTEKAIRILSRNNNGYFLLVEGQLNHVDIKRHVDVIIVSCA
jgi:alkaline phosphatase